MSQVIQSRGGLPSIVMEFVASLLLQASNRMLESFECYEQMVRVQCFIGNSAL